MSAVLIAERTHDADVRSVDRDVIDRVAPVIPIRPLTRSRRQCAAAPGLPGRPVRFNVEPDRGGLGTNRPPRRPGGA